MWGNLLSRQPSQAIVGTWAYVHEIQMIEWYGHDFKINMFKNLKDTKVEILVKRKLIYEINSD